MPHPQISVAAESRVVQEPNGPTGVSWVGHRQLSGVHRLEGTLSPGHHPRGPCEICEFQNLLLGAWSCIYLCPQTYLHTEGAAYSLYVSWGRLACRSICERNEWWILRTMYSHLPCPPAVSRTPVFSTRQDWSTLNHSGSVLLTLCLTQGWRSDLEAQNHRQNNGPQSQDPRFPTFRNDNYFDTIPQWSLVYLELVITDFGHFIG